MSGEQITNNKKKQSVGSIEAYQILLQRQMSEDRLLGERTSIFLLASSFLFLAFITLLNSDLGAPIYKLLCTILALLGIFLTICIFHLNQSAINALAFWHVGQRKIEEEAPEFDYMRVNEITPHIYGYECALGQKEWRRNKDGKWVLERIEKFRGRLRKPPLGAGGTGVIYRIYLPLLFLLLWLVSLVVAIIY